MNAVVISNLQKNVNSDPETVSTNAAVNRQNLSKEPNRWRTIKQEGAGGFAVSWTVEWKRTNKQAKKDRTNKQTKQYGN